MSLRRFHLFFIVISLALSLFLLVYGFLNEHWLRFVGIIWLLLLIPYLRWFQKKIQPAVLLFFSSALSSPLALACPVCFRDPNSPLNKGAQMGVFFLIGVVALVLIVILKVGLSWARKDQKS